MSAAVLPTNRCGACGAALDAGAAFCAVCGVRVGPPAAPASAAGWSLGADVDDAVAPVWRRLLALLVDQALAVVVGGLGVAAVLPALRDGATGSLLVPGLALLVLGAVQWFAEAFGGRTAGGALLGIRTVSARTGRPAGLWPVLVRSAVQALGVLLGGVGVYVVAASGAWDEGPEQRGWHDKVAGTLVLRARPRAREAERVPGGEAARVPASDAGPGAGSGAASGAAEPWTPPVVAPAAAAAPAAPAAPVALPDTTVPTLPALGDLEHTRLARPVDPVAAAGRALALVLDTGERVPVDGPGLIGRRPAPEDAPDARLVTLPDPGVSRVHLAYRPLPDGTLEVTDRGATNGTVLLDPSGARWALPAGAPARVAPGWTLLLGPRRVAVAEA
ncbi:RDD family protein [Cellulomonas hominis]|uniref:RDD family protein n=1 Tax=Cellulomonas hominis TaxID=156981 RepID=UPI001C1090C9|nr:RDD family protein [Cellulomonas hominis]MBU5422018.1 RDD family protein [Cellulomonas hominis]